MQCLHVGVHLHADVLTGTGRFIGFRWFFFLLVCIHCAFAYRFRIGIDRSHNDYLEEYVRVVMCVCVCVMGRVTFCFRCVLYFLVLMCLSCVVCPFANEITLHLRTPSSILPHLLPSILLIFPKIHYFNVQQKHQTSNIKHPSTRKINHHTPSLYPIQNPTPHASHASKDIHRSPYFRSNWPPEKCPGKHNNKCKLKYKYSTTINNNLCKIQNTISSSTTRFTTTNRPQRTPRRRPPPPSSHQPAHAASPSVVYATSRSAFARIPSTLTTRVRLLHHVPNTRAGSGDIPPTPPTLWW